MAEKKSRAEAWQDNYDALCAYVKVHRQFPDKKKEESRGLLNWWKYNKKRIKQGKMDQRRIEMLQKLSDMRDEAYIKFWIRNFELGIILGFAYDLELFSFDFINKGVKKPKLLNSFSYI